MLEATQVSRRYGWRWALQGVDFALGRGQRVAILGANGSGKTTLLRVLAGLLRPTEGEVHFDGAPLSSSNRGRIGLLSHDPFLYPALTLKENLEYFGKLYHLSVDAIEKRKDHLTDILGLRERLNDPVRILSQGLRQRASMARAMLHEPDVLLLDEPFAGLDPGAAERLESTLVDLAGKERGEGRSLLLTTHDVSRALALSDEVAVLATGKVVIRRKTQEVSTEELTQAVEQGAGK